MKSVRILLLAFFLFSFHAFAWQAALPSLPTTPKHPVVDEYHGVKVTDNYRWLEDGKNPEVISWTNSENEHSRAILDALPTHAAIQQFLKQLDAASSPSFYDLQLWAGTLFAMNWQPGKQQPMLVTLRSPEELSSKHVVLDPAQLDSTNSTAIQFYVPSHDASKVAVSLAQGGTEAGTVRVFDVATGRPLPDVVPHVTALGGGSLAWNADGGGFYYTRYPREGERPQQDLNFFAQIYFHKLGTSTSEDAYVLGKDFPRIAEITLDASHDGKYLLATVENGDGGDYEHFLRGLDGTWTQITQFPDGIKSIALGEDALYMLSRDHAPRGKLLRTPLETPTPKDAKTIVPESTAVIQDFRFSLAGLQPSFVPTTTLLYVTELVGGPSEIRIFDHQGREVGIVPAEPVSTITQILPLHNDDILFGNISYLDPMAWFRYDPSTKKATITAMRESSPLSFADVEVSREFATSKDGTKVPLDILHRRGVKLDGQNPAILTGYGGFGLSQTPYFDPAIRPWLDAGGVFASANLRGGGEFGEDWHQQGMLTHKQNVFDDFIAAAEHLISTGYTNSSKLGIEGGSNGGLLMGAVLTQRPDLFRAVVSVAGLYDMLRSETTQNGQYNTTEYGSVKHPEQFAAMYRYSPYQHVRDGVSYPSILFMVGENDPRVDPWHTRKFVAALQAANSAKNPILLISFSNSGHGGIGSAEDQQIAMSTYGVEFMYDQLGVKWVTLEMPKQPNFSAAARLSTSPK
ncbi:MAG TPA: prolyl oligopeptidase family serine peptidase [Terriglobales bacterium]|nr:prolyl oligopeptidase family serine peptidase [Terriglobales bacterium]